MAAESAVAGLAAAADEAAAKKEEDEDEGEEEDPLLVTRAALHALTNLANGNLACKTAVVEAGGAAAMAAVMKARGSDEAIAKICVGGLANVGGGDEACVRAMISSGGVDAVVQAVRLFTKASPVSLGDALLALGRAEPAALGVGDGIAQEEVVLHVDDEQRVIRADGVDGREGRRVAEQREVLLQVRRVLGGEGGRGPVHGSRAPSCRASFRRGRRAPADDEW